MWLVLLGVWFSAFAPASVNAADDVLTGPVAASVLRVVDGDTLDVAARTWPGTTVRTLVRLRDVDTPEVKGACARERRYANRARAFTAGAVASGEVYLSDIGTDKYGGRVLASVSTAQVGDIADALIAAGLARPYDGGRRRGWCD